MCLNQKYDRKVVIFFGLLNILEKLMNSLKMFVLEKWGDEEYEKKLQELVLKDDNLIRDVIRKIKLEKGLN